MILLLTKRVRHLVILTLGIFAHCFAQTVSAHTTLVPSTLTEGERVFANISISHGCDGKPVRAMGVLFPTDTSLLEQVADPANLPASYSDHFTRAPDARLAQDRDVFRSNTLTRDSSGARRAFHYNHGYLKPDLTGQLPFRFTAPRFADASCAKQVDVLIPIVNWCSRSRSKPDRVDVWMGRPTAKFNDPAVQPAGFWPRIAVHRDMENNPFTSEACGDGIDLEWSPTDDEIDDMLPLDGYWPANVSP